VDGLEVTVFPVSDKKPKYVQSSADGPWVVAYRIADPSGGVLVYAPCLKTWPDGFDSLVSDANCVILDGTFYSADEMSGTGVGSGAQRAMGHIPIVDSLAHVAAHPGKQWIYTHLNNTNPVLDPGSVEYESVLSGGASVPLDGTEIHL
jgi:pyrroloquinoline quinone biosynthesis protein B